MKINVEAISPGRVNIIGEHVDHQFYDVLPCALSNKFISFKTSHNESSKAITFESLRDGEVYTFKTEDSQDLVTKSIDRKSNSFSKYVLSGLFGFCEYIISDYDMTKVGLLIDSSCGNHIANNNLNFLLADQNLPNINNVKEFLSLLEGYTFNIESTLAEASGMSSSSAFVTGLLACFKELFLNSENTIKTNGSKWDKKSMAELAINAERHCGTCSGGMDQSVIVMGEEGFALNVLFEPLRTKKVELPEGFELILANTCKSSEKAVSAPFEYNKRVAELRLANLLILKAVYEEPNYIELRNPEFDFKTHWDDINFLPRARELQEILRISDLETFLTPLTGLCDAVLKKSYTKEEIFEIFDHNKLNQLMKYCSVEVFEMNDFFDMRGPLKHVFGETKRVHDFIKVCEVENKVENNKHVELGRLMNESHFSMSNQFGAGCPELETLSQICRDAGAYGARTTGAGWGGSIVVACSSDKVNKIMEECKRLYYIPNYENPALKVSKMCPNKENFDKVLFSTKPGKGLVSKII